MKKIAFFGGSFDPVHNGHIALGRALLGQFSLHEMVLIPAFHAPHKLRIKPTSAYDRYAMLCLATQYDDEVSVSQMELEQPERPYSVETLARLNAMYPDDEIFFVMGADSWRDITLWREWESVLSLTDHIVVTRPGVDIGTEHVTSDIRKRILDVRGVAKVAVERADERKIFITDVVNIDVSATQIRRQIRDNESGWRSQVPADVAKYIEKYQIYS